MRIDMKNFIFDNTKQKMLFNINFAAETDFILGLTGFWNRLLRGYQ